MNCVLTNVRHVNQNDDPFKMSRLVENIQKWFKKRMTSIIEEEFHDYNENKNTKLDSIQIQWMRLLEVCVCVCIRVRMCVCLCSCRA